MGWPIFERQYATRTPGQSAINPSQKEKKRRRQTDIIIDPEIMARTQKVYPQRQAGGGGRGEREGRGGGGGGGGWGGGGGVGGGGRGGAGEGKKVAGWAQALGGPLIGEVR